MADLQKFVVIVLTTGFAGTLLLHPVGWIFAVVLGPLVAYRVIGVAPNEPL